MARKSSPAYITEQDVFARRLTEIMEKRGLSQTQLSAKIKEEQQKVIQRQTISQYMSGQSKPDTERLTILCNALNVSADYLLGRSECQTAEANIESAIITTGLSEGAIFILRDLKQSQNAPKRCSEIMEAINVLLDEKYFSDSYWHRLYAFLFTPGADFKILLPAGEFPLKRDEALRALLEQNNDFLTQLKAKMIEDSKGAADNGKH